MAIVAADWALTRANGNIRYIGDDHGGSPTYATVIEFHRWLQGLADDASSVGDDEVDITDLLPSSRSTDNIIRLLGAYNIDANAAEHLYDGSIIQGAGGTEEIYDGIVNFGTAGIAIQIIQNGAVLADDWWNSNSGLNADAGQGISHRFMIKVRTAGADIDGRRLTGISRTFGNTYSEFNINGTSRGNNVFALTEAGDLNNIKTLATVAAYTGITNTTEGYIGLDVDNNAVNEFYYSQWNTNQPTRTINDFYERLKWLSKDPVAEDSNADTGTDYIVGNGTLTGQAQTFLVGANTTLATKAVFNLKKVLAPTGNITCTLYAISGTSGTTGIPTGTAIATSDAILAENLTLSYTPVTFTFSTPVSLTAATDYAVAVEFTNGDASNYVHVQGSVTGTHSGNQSDETATVWLPSAAEDLNFQIYTSPALYGIPGVLFRGITHEVAISGGAGTWVEPESLSWGTGATAGTGQLLAVDNTAGASSTKLWMQLLTGVAPNANTITGNGGATATAGTVTSRVGLLSKPFVGASTGTALIGSYGLGVETADLSSSDKVFDLTNTQITPPNNVTFTVSGVVVGEDRILVAPWDGVTNDSQGNPAINKSQFSLNTTLSGATETAVVISTAIPSDTPATGDIRIELDTGQYREVPYTSWSGSTFTIASTDFSGGLQATSTNNVWIAYIDKIAGATSEAVTMVYLADRNFVVIVRDGAGTPIKEFISAAALTITGGSISVIRTSDE